MGHIHIYQTSVGSSEYTKLLDWEETIILTVDWYHLSKAATLPLKSPDAIEITDYCEELVLNLGP